MKKIILFIIACLIVCSCSKRDILEGTTWESPGVTLTFNYSFATLKIGSYSDDYSYSVMANVVTMVPIYNFDRANLSGKISGDKMTITNLSSNKIVSILTKK